MNIVCIHRLSLYVYINISQNESSRKVIQVRNFVPSLTWLSLSRNHTEEDNYIIKLKLHTVIYWSEWSCSIIHNFLVITALHGFKWSILPLLLHYSSFNNFLGQLTYNPFNYENTLLLLLYRDYYFRQIPTFLHNQIHRMADISSHYCYSWIYKHIYCIQPNNIPEMWNIFLYIFVVFVSGGCGTILAAGMDGSIKISTLLQQ